MYFTIYKITNIINNKCYIGKHQTEKLDDDYMGSGKLIKRAIQKYGLANFRKEILFVFSTQDEMNVKEMELVTEDFCARSDTYNLCPGGQGGFGYINQNSLNRSEWHDITKEQHMMEMSKLSKVALEEKRKDPSWKDNWKKNVSSSALKRIARDGAPFTGKKHTNETKKLIGTKNSQHMRGKGNSQYGTMWITNGNINKKVSNLDVIPDGWRRGRSPSFEEKR